MNDLSPSTNGTFSRHSNPISTSTQNKISMLHITWKILFPELKRVEQRTFARLCPYSHKGHLNEITVKLPQKRQLPKVTVYLKRQISFTYINNLGSSTPLYTKHISVFPMVFALERLHCIHCLHAYTQINK